MGNYYAPFSLRISETLITKLKIIAIENKRSTNKEMEYALEKYVNEYEKAHGEVPVYGYAKAPVHGLFRCPCIGAVYFAAL